MRTVLLSAALLFCACGPLIDAEVEGVELCDDAAVIDIPGAPIESLQTLNHQAHWSLSGELRAQLQAAELAGELASVSLSGEGVDDLSFLKAATLAATLRGQTRSLDWDGALQPDGSVLLRPETPLDVTPLLNEEAAVLDTTLTAQLPPEPWKLKLRACVVTSASLSM